MGRITTLKAKATKTLVGWVARSELEGGRLEQVLVTRGEEGFSEAIATTVASLGRGTVVPLRWIGGGCKGVGAREGDRATEAEVAKVLAHHVKLDGTPIPKREMKNKKNEKEEEDENKEEREENTSYSIVFTVPKSISLLMCHEDENFRKAVENCVEESLKETIGYLDKNVTTRLGAQGIITAQTEGIIAAYAMHKSNSCGEPHVHVHVIMSTLVKPKETEDGKYRKIDTVVLFGSLFRRAEAIFHRTIKEKIIEKTTLESRDFVRKRVGSLITFEIENLIEDIDNFSGAKQHIEEIIERMELSPAIWEQKQLAWNVHRTEIKNEMNDESVRTDRKRMIEEIEHIIDKRLTEGGEPAKEIIRIWREKGGKEFADKLDKIGIMEEQIHRVIKNEIPEEGAKIIQAWLNKEISEDEENKAEFLAAAKNLNAELTEAIGIWRPSDMIASLTAFVDEETARKITADAIEYLSKSQEIKLKRPEKTAEVIRNGWSQKTEEMRLAFSISSKVIPSIIENREKTIREKSKQMAAEKRQKEIKAEMIKETLSVEQYDALRKMLEGKGLVAIEGVAGAGKSFLLKTFKELVSEEIVIVSRNAKLANELGREVDTRSETVARFVTRNTAPDGVVIIDEASLVDQKDWFRITEICHQNKKCRIIAIGDRRQISPIDRIGTWQAIIEEAAQNDAYVMLNFSYRCREWMEEHSKWRNGTLDPEDISDRIIEGDMREIAQRAIAENATIITTTNELASQVSEIVQTNKGITRDLRTRLRFDMACGIGDKIRIRRNDYQRGIFNGDTVEVIGIYENGNLEVRRENGTKTFITKKFASENCELAYAITADSAQGITVERSLVLLEGNWERNQLYVAASRGRKPPIVAAQSNAKQKLTEFLRQDSEVRSVREMVNEIGRDYELSLLSKLTGGRQKWKKIKTEKTILAYVLGGEQPQTPNQKIQENTGEEKAMKQVRFTIGEACELVRRVQFAPELGEIFGLACEDTDWHWVRFELDDNGKSYWVPCVWDNHSKTVSCLTNTYEWWEREAEIYAAINPNASEEEIQRIIDLGREILHRASYYHPIEPTGERPAEIQLQMKKRTERTEQGPEPPPRREPGMGW